MGSNSNKLSMALFPQPQPTSADIHRTALTANQMKIGEQERVGVWQGHIRSVTRHFEFESQQGLQGRQAVSVPALPSHTSGASFSYEHKANSNRRKRRCRGGFIPFRVFQGLCRGCLGSRGAIGKFWYSVWANANPSPVAACLSVCREDNVGFFYLPSLPLTVVSAV